MRNVYLIVLALSVTAWGGRRRTCERLGYQLYQYSLKPQITGELLSKSSSVVRSMSEKCATDDIIIEIDKQDKNLGTVVRLFGRICRKSSSVEAVKHFMAYRLRHAESADEEFSLVVEQLFVGKPSETLAFIRKQKDSVKTQLLNDIVWGFLTNRVYGPKNPYEEDPGRRFRSIAEIPKEILNRHNYRQIFFSLNRGMQQVSQEYRQEVSYVLEQIGKYLNTWGVEY